jgi:DNA-binding XRE family transcriptional regulator
MDIIRPVGYDDKASWLLFSRFFGGAEMASAGWFAGRLRELREAAGWTQEQLAERVGVKREAIARWEAGKREPGWSNVLALCEALACSCEAFTRPPAGRPPAGPGRPKKEPAESPAPKRPRGRPPKAN